MDIQTEHMKLRCYFISAMFSMSLYTWYNYSLFDPIDNSFMTPYYQNCLFFLFYLGWDTYHMITNPILFRTDLMIHHTLSSFTYISFFHICPLQMSNCLILECISLMNYVWRNNPQLLNLYRTVCILCVRLPLWSWIWIYYFPNYILTHYILILSPNHYVYLSITSKIMIFFTIYDLFLLHKLYNPKKSNNK